jgi:hypothetical protein
MGVLACDRKGCENIMCDRYSEVYGYICEECFEEFAQSDASCGDIVFFMHSRKTKLETHVEARRAFLNEIFRRRES